MIEKPNIWKEIDAWPCFQWACMGATSCGQCWRLWFMAIPHCASWPSWGFYDPAAGGPTAAPSGIFCERPSISKSLDLHLIWKVPGFAPPPWPCNDLGTERDFSSCFRWPQSLPRDLIGWYFVHGRYVHRRTLPSRPPVWRQPIASTIGARSWILQKYLHVVAGRWTIGSPRRVHVNRAAQHGRTSTRPLAAE